MPIRHPFGIFSQRVRLMSRLVPTYGARILDQQVFVHACFIVDMFAEIMMVGSVQSVSHFYNGKVAGYSSRYCSLLGHHHLRYASVRISRKQGYV